MNPILWIMGIGKYRNNQNWNIGFCEITPAVLVRERKLPRVHWLRHGYNDRFFADPFILRMDETAIYVLVEEMMFHTKGVISLLTVDPRSYSLIDRKVILDLDTHLSYPAIFRENGKIYLYPENYASGQLSLYELDLDGLSLKHVRQLVDKPLTDATVYAAPDGKFYMISTLSSNSRDNAYLFVNDSMSDGFKVSKDPVVTGKDRSRCGGGFFHAGGRLFRPAQNCSRRYGGALKIMEVVRCEQSDYFEIECFDLKPHSWRYNLGMHTLNFDPDCRLAVIDSYGYLYPFIGRVLDNVFRIYHTIRGDGVSLS